MKQGTIVIRPCSWLVPCFTKRRSSQASSALALVRWVLAGAGLVAQTGSEADFSKIIANAGDRVLVLADHRAEKRLLQC
eukprot:3773403-Amphidinium_carterae.1